MMAETRKKKGPLCIGGSFFVGGKIYWNKRTSQVDH